VGVCNKALSKNAGIFENGDSNDDHKETEELLGARLLRGTFLMLSRKHDDAMMDFDYIVSHPTGSPKIRQVVVRRPKKCFNRLRTY